MKHCKKMDIKVLSDGTKTYSCNRCKKLSTCKKEDAKTARAMHNAMASFRW